MTKKSNEHKSISLIQMKEAIEKSGYLIEQRVEGVLEKEGYYVQTNPVFPDPETGKSREIDIDALSGIRIYKEGYNFIFPNIICECKNNAFPIVFFAKESIVSFLHHQEIKLSGLPIKFWKDDSYLDFSEFVGMDKFHHYCKGLIATQYCTFKMKNDKSSWMAFHSDEQHELFNSLVKSLEYSISRHYEGWVLPDNSEEEEINIQIYYPLLILEKDLYIASLKKNNLEIKKINHIQFRKELFNVKSNKVETYQIDVIIENYLERYLNIIDSEINKIKKILQRKKPEVKLSIDKILKDAKDQKNQTKSIQEVFES
ncbi:MAG: hypothetical protein ACLP2P_05025 [Desulfobaccales bacterium]